MTPKTPTRALTPHALSALAAVAILAGSTGCTTPESGDCPAEFGDAIHQVAGLADAGIVCDRQVIAGRLTFAVATEEQLAEAVERTLAGLAASGLADDWTLRVTFADQRGLMFFNASAIESLPPDPTLGQVRGNNNGK